MVGGVLSVTLIVCDLLEELPQESVAVQVLVTLYFCGQFPGVVTSTKVKDGLLSHTSVAVGLLNTGVAGHEIVDAPLTPLITGAVMSCTSIVCEAVELFPQASVAVQVRVTLYSPAQLPSIVSSSKVNVKLLPHASVAVAVSKDGVAGQFITVGSGNPSIVGAVTSCT